ncbi:Wzz/FepE/Etk N-terminal domain-containing protein [Kangiella sp. HZ709]|uniref:Wzz/FepE/Etk N-terminal domain-containing protein n=1 Tax=Kangiella sp. HZ709 TaxID=2666328 RepID=UPI0012AF933D|nr:Wzz/FepE/Etk N-terminal domain-containing protein [Kangiella sp. HZ709]MRX27159.1 LPS O-antigen length regulator [Kangiella sp. HZ709]
MNNEYNKPFNQAQQSYQDDEIDLRELFSIILKGKWIVIAITLFCTMASVALALYLPNEYKASAVVQPNNSSGSGGKLASLAGQFGGLASLAGINIGGNESTDAVIAMEVMKSWGFVENFISKHNLAIPLFAATKWEQSTNELVYDQGLYNEAEHKWVRKAPKGKTVEPTSWELYEEFKKRLSISKDKESGLINIAITHYSPIIAKQWTDLIIQDLNNFMKVRALNDANQSIEYLEKQISQTSIAEIRTVFSELIQEQHKTKMLAQVSDEYIFKTVSSAKVPEEKVKPKRALIVVLGFVLGLFLSVLLVLMLNYFKDSKK